MGEKQDGRKGGKEERRRRGKEERRKGGEDAVCPPSLATKRKVVGGKPQRQAPQSLTLQSVPHHGIGEFPMSLTKFS